MAQPQEFFALDRFVARVGPYRAVSFHALNGHDFFRLLVQEIEQHVDVSSNTPLPYTRLETVYRLIVDVRRWLFRTDIGITLTDTITTGYVDLVTYLTVRAWYFYNFDILWRNLFAHCIGESRRIQREILDLEDAALREDLLNDSYYYFERLDTISFPTDGYNSDSTDNPFYLYQDSLVEHVQDMSRTSPPDVHLSFNSCQLIISYGHQVTLTILVPCPVAVLNFES